MKIQMLLIVMLAMSNLFIACQTRPTNQAALADSCMVCNADTILTVCNSEDTAAAPSQNYVPKTDKEKEIIAELFEIMKFVQQMYNDILSHYTAETNGQQYAYDHYASAALRKLLTDWEAACNETDTDILGWDCDPWICAQEWNHPIAEVLFAESLSDTMCWVDVTMHDFGDTDFTLILSKVNDQWLVDDFLTADISFATALQKEIEEALNLKNNQLNQ